MLVTTREPECALAVAGSNSTSIDHASWPEAATERGKVTGCVKLWMLLPMFFRENPVPFALMPVTDNERSPVLARETVCVKAAPPAPSAATLPKATDRLDAGGRLVPLAES